MHDCETSLRPMQAVALATAMLREHGLHDWRAVLDNARTRAGLCNHTRREISLSKPLLGRGEASTRDTILHEIAHALVGPDHGHDAVWRRQHLELGGDGKRCFEHTDDTSPWVGTCAHGKQIPRYRAPKRTHGWRCRCPQGSSPVVWTERNPQ